jgi:sugar transferase (PEP-CTERM/EpsH1 system associated)
MEILFLTHRMPYPPDKGERIRAYHELKYLAGRHEVDLFCFADTREDAENQDKCREMCRSVYVEVLSRPARRLRSAVSFLRGQPMSSGFFYSPRFAEAVRRRLREFRYDLIFVYCSSMGQFIPSPAPAPVVVDFVDADSAKWKQYAASSVPPWSWLYAWEGHTIAASELALGRRAALSLAVTAHDASELGGAATGCFPVEVMANGAEIPARFCDAVESSTSQIQPYVLFVGTMNYKPNCDAVQHFAHDIFPLVRRRHPDLNFVIVGRDPDREVRRLADIPGITVTGSVPDVYEYFRNAEVSVAPFRISQGFHNKIAESLAMGTAVVASSRAVAGVGLSKQDGLFAANNPKEFAQTVDSVLSNSLLRRELRRAAPTVRQKLSWESRLCRLEELMIQIVDQAAIASPELVAGLN